MAAMSKAIASTITYPFSLAKARAQTSSSPPVDTDSAEKIKDEVGNADSTGKANKVQKDARSLAGRSTVFHTVLKIYREDGLAALYEGVWGEILKGFFSHGITMIVKESIHKLIIQAYYLILRALNKYPSPTDIASQARDEVEKAGEAAKQAYGNVSETVGSAIVSGKEAVGIAAERAGTARSNATEKAGNMVKSGYENVTGTVGDAFESGKQAVGTAVERAGAIGSNTSEKTGRLVKGSSESVSGTVGNAVGIATERAGVVGSNAPKTAITAEEYASEDAGHLLGNAREMLGGTVEEIGKGIKPK